MGQYWVGNSSDCSPSRPSESKVASIQGRWKVGSSSQRAVTKEVTPRAGKPMSILPFDCLDHGSGVSSKYWEITLRISNAVASSGSKLLQSCSLSKCHVSALLEAETTESATKCHDGAAQHGGSAQNIFPFPAIQRRRSLLRKRDRTCAILHGCRATREQRVLVASSLSFLS